MDQRIGIEMNDSCRQPVNHSTNLGAETFCSNVRGFLKSECRVISPPSES